MVFSVPVFGHVEQQSSTLVVPLLLLPEDDTKKGPGGEVRDKKNPYCCLENYNGFCVPVCILPPQLWKG